MSMNIKQTIFQHYPALPVAVSIIIGIMAGGQIHNEMAWMALTLATTAIAALTGRHPKCQSTAVLLGFMSLGAFLAVWQERNVAVMLPEKAITYDAVVTSEAKEHAKTWSADIMITSGIMKGKTVKAFFLKKNTSPPLPTLRLHATSTMTMPQRKPGGAFDYGKYLLRHGTSATTFIPPWKCRLNGFGTEELPVTTAVTAKLRLIRLMLIKQIGGWGMDADTESLIAGVAMGQKSSISPTLRNAYSQAGAAHVLALSGLHLGIIWAVLGVFCIGRWRTPFTMLMISTIWTYVLFAAMPPSAVRAAIMLTLMSVATLTGRQGASLNTLAFAAIAILLFSPSGIYDLGFQLSFTAVAFIVVFTNPVMNLLPLQWRIAHPWATQLVSMITVSSVANLGTLPLVAFHFSRIPIYIIATNLVAIPLITVLLWMFAISMFIMAAGSPAILLTPATAILNITAKALNSSMTAIASLPCSSISIHISAVQAVILYIAIISLLWAATIIAGNKHERKIT